MRVLALIAVASIAMLGCSTRDYLRPSAEYGQYSTENPACPGAQEVLEFHPTDEDWIIFRVAARLPDLNQPAGTRLIAYFRFVNYRLPAGTGTLKALFPNAEEQARREKITHDRARQDIIISAPNPIATIVFPDGSETRISLPFFEQPFNHQEVEYPTTPWGPEVVISPKRVEAFKVIFPDIYLNGRSWKCPQSSSLRQVIGSRLSSIARQLPSSITMETDA